MIYLIARITYYVADYQIKSNQFYLYSPKSQSHCLNGLYSLYSEQHPLSFDSSQEKLHMLMEKKTFEQGKKKTMEETSGRATEEGSLFQDRQTCNISRVQKSATMMPSFI